MNGAGAPLVAATVPNKFASPCCGYLTDIRIPIIAPSNAPFVNPQLADIVCTTDTSRTRTLTPVVFAHTVGNGAQLTVTVTGTNDEVIRDDRIRAQVEEDDIFGLFIFYRIDDKTGEFN